MSKKVSRRDFARTSVAAGAAAVAMPGVLVGKTPAVTRGAAAAGRLAALGRRSIAYGGDAEFRDSISLAYGSQGATAAPDAPAVIGSWRQGMTIPGEYYVDERHYDDDERYIAENMWLLADHASRIPAPGDYFVFEYGRSESVIILRDPAGEVKGYQNVCRHRGSRLCRHDEGPLPVDARLSVRQLRSSGNTPVFRCPYHAWTYDLDGKLISAPNGMPADFEMAENGLLPAHVRTVEGLIYVNFSRGTPPDFDSFVARIRDRAVELAVAQLKVAARISYPTKANWKLALENFQECYHCGPAHRSLVTAHPFWDGLMPAGQRARLETELQPFIPPRPPTAAGGMTGGSSFGSILGVDYATGSLDGKPLSKLLPPFSAYTHRSRISNSGWMTGNLQGYDDHIAMVRFTPRGVMMTDAEIVWLVHPEAEEGRDYDVEKLTALWDITMLEDKWIVENNHLGIQSGSYTPGSYAATERGPIRLVTWYMTEVLSAEEREKLASSV